MLDPPGPESAGRYHRPGEAVLYMSPTLDWARIAVATYMRKDGIARVAVPLELDGAWVVDQRDRSACSALGIDPALSALPWQDALQRGEEPPSWINATKARAAGADGLIDPSRSIPGGWHLDLFRWNTPGDPQVTRAGKHVAVTLRADDPQV